MTYYIIYNIMIQKPEEHDPITNLNFLKDQRNNIAEGNTNLYHNYDKLIYKNVNEPFNIYLLEGFFNE